MTVTKTRTLLVLAGLVAALVTACGEPELNRRAQEAEGSGGGTGENESPAPGIPPGLPSGGTPPG